MLKHLTSPYIKPSHKQNVMNYKYKGSDNSIFFTLVTSPFCAWIVSHLPAWLAPNIITTVGFLCNTTYFIATTYYTGFNAGQPLPPWLCYFTAFWYCMYIVVDNCDGKQSRKHKTSTPLGFLFDHGSDAVTPLFITCGLCTVLYYDDMKWYALFYISVSFTFFLNTWEEFYIGELNLPIIHGVSEGTVLLASVCCVSGLYGKSFYTTSFTLCGYDIQYRDVVVLFTLCGSVVFGFASFFNVLLFKCRDKWKQALGDTVVYTVFLLAFVMVAFWSDCTIATKYPKVVIIVFGFAFAKMMGIMQLCHICNCEYDQYQLSYMCCFIACIVYVAVYKLTGVKIGGDMDWMIIACGVVNVIAWLHYVVCVCKEICEIMGIYVYSVAKRQRNEVRKLKST